MSYVFNPLTLFVVLYVGCKLRERYQLRKLLRDPAFRAQVLAAHRHITGR